MGNAVLIILALILVAILWVAGGSFIQQPAAPNIGPSDEESIDKEASAESLAAPEVRLIKIYSANSRAADPQEEYIELQADYANTVPINITGWRLKNRKENVFIIPTASGLPYSARVNIQENIVLKPGEKAVVVTGQSPIGTSFKPNLCTGYFNRLYEFRPALTENCPSPHKEEGVDAQDNACFSYLKNLRGCQTPDPADIPSDADFQCREFIDQRLNYAACVEAHKKDDGFFDNEWRVYLEKTQEIWSDIRENIKLSDQNSNLIAETSI